MEILTDLHCHTIASTHAFSTVLENVTYAKAAGIELIAITDHSIALPDSPHIFHFECMRMIPEHIEGIRVLRGIELNILNKNGDIDMDSHVLDRLDIAIASIHTPCYENCGEEDHTDAYLNVLDNPYVDILGHTDSVDFKYDIDKVLLKAREKNKLIEINNHHIASKKNYERCVLIANRCSELGVGVCADSDAHICFNVGNVSKSLALLESINFPEELIINRSIESLRKFFGPERNF